MPEIVCRTYFKQLISGLEACHGIGVAHRDVKLQNILIGDKGQLLLADFGASKTFKPTVPANTDEHEKAEDKEESSSELVFEPETDLEEMKSWTGSSGYQAPEILARKRYDNA